MKAAVYYGPQDIRCTDIPDPVIRSDHEMLVKVTATSICGSDLHLYRGALDGIMEKGKSQTGHELIGEVVEVGKSVGRFKQGDRVSMGYSVSCGHCYMCEVGQTAHCETTKNAVYGFGIPFGSINGTHAEALIVPHADGHAMNVPKGIPDEAAVTLSCNLPSAIIANRLADIQVGENVALVGCGPTGMMTLDIALHRGPGRVVVLDKVAHRLDVVRKKGGVAIDANQEDWKEKALAETGGRGFDKVIEVVGYPETLQMCLDLVRPGGTVAAIGVFCDSTFNLNLADVFLRNISLHMNGFANAQPYMWEALRLMERGVINPQEYFSHAFELADVDKAFSVFHQKSDSAMKVLIRP
ncbi:alcohol dehydrogenase [Burkholderia stabilis]|uniref:Alcohol dehydrogenase GroES-like protein (Belongs to CMGI-2) n=1 Tax=Cupriavidus metallidurans (strain ATCC 43123 / DSM 2839 / NBRC 102507 / CH34) TaxID=266264 RepID=Q1LNT3_CUPMC|nr:MULTISPECIES: alcohol dehydrogenase [Burkholderiaceae]ABF08193.1 Alcohol dehydrogenase GroES-like protein (belongs to CMGI-2) [Cupriavidus metallidurans CH34]AOR67946.1 alcohol dehydrogenase [Burkholderia stabilis]MBR8028340.1 alcohol dehydrogenase catalytic domain-containing protein [Burkholderia cenocepacia]MBR8171147.1 alcohol dehydrogenase catalytic domain-containing protein [Burkholderia cenocepacia]QGS27544.1 alcohol dehydrogenase catalytic domain-containing protein [Cupriavidus metal